MTEIILGARSSRGVCDCPAALSEIFLQERGTFIRRHEAWTRKIFKQGCEQFDTDQLSAVEHITIQKLAADSIGHPIEVPHLIKEQISKSIVNK